MTMPPEPPPHERDVIYVKDSNGKPAYSWLRDFPWSPAFWLLIQTVGVIVFIVRLQDQVNILQRDVQMLEQRLASIDAGGSRGLELLKQQVTSNSARLEAGATRDNELFKMVNEFILRSSTEGPKVQGQIEVLSNTVRRLDDQQIRIIGALDNTYNLLQEHMRAMRPDVGQNPPNKKLNLDRERDR